ncbi:MAG: DNA adenine methylase [Planctomycetota bacterium]|nr:MAG: DNA adenine methylase [Planctomycetota bacterium]
MLELQKRTTRPVLKWAGGKSQLLGELIPLMPREYGKYIEPFIGGGALFFATAPENSVLSDSNTELMNMYRVIRDDVVTLIAELQNFKNSKSFFYEVRSWDTSKLNPVEKAARTIYLNRTCFNGLFRVNKKGQFNVPYGHYKRPNICDCDSLFAASEVLSNSQIGSGDYKNILREFAEPGDFIFLDPPYLPISEYSDFKRYTKEQFYEEDHLDLAEEVQRLYDLGCYVILTNSNHPVVHDLYKKFPITILQTRRNISSNGSGRKGEDVIVTAFPHRRTMVTVSPPACSAQAQEFPSTRYMGSKAKLLPYIRDVVSGLSCHSVYDIFSGSGVVSYMLKTEGKQVSCNDYMKMNHMVGKALIENNTTKLSLSKAEGLLENDSPHADTFVQDTFSSLYYSDEENELIDRIRGNISNIRNSFEKAIAVSALVRACIKKRPRGIFTYVGHRYDDGRKDLILSLEEQFLLAVKAINDAVFDNGHKNKSRCGDALTIQTVPDLVYIDPPYYSPYSDNEYVRRYHFVEGIARNWEGVDIQWNTKTKKFKNYPTPFSTKTGAHSAFDILFRRFRKSKIVVSYSSNSFPTLDEIVALMAKHKNHVEVISIDYRYSFANRAENLKNKVQEYLFVGY